MEQKNQRRLPIEVIIAIGKKRYQQVISRELKEGDLVLDTKDNCYGIIEEIHKYVNQQYADVRDGDVVEVCIPLNRLRLLKPIAS